MRRLIYILLIILFSDVSHAQTMLSESSVWVYKETKYSVESRDTEAVYTYKYFVNGESVVNDKKYYNIWRVPDRPSGVLEESVVAVEDTMYVISLREENGKVYAPKGVYINACRIEHIGFGNSRVDTGTADMIFALEGDEYILYDFSLEQENTIPFVGNTHSLLFYPESLNFIVFVESNLNYYVDELNLFYKDGKIEYISPNYIENSFFPDITKEVQVPYSYNYTNPEIVVTKDDIKQNHLFKENIIWTYKRLGYYRDYSSRENSPVCEVEFFKYYINGTSAVSGRKYVDVWKQSISYITETNIDYKGSDDMQMDTHYVMSVREENGKVYARNLYGASESDNREKSDIYMDECFMKDGCEYVIYDLSRQNEEIIPDIGHKLSLLFPNSHFTSNNLRWCTSFISPNTYIVHDESLNLFIRNGQTVYISPNYYPDPFFPDVVADGVEQVSYYPNSDSIMYNLQGQRMAIPQRGINIVGGRKVLVR